MEYCNFNLGFMEDWSPQQAYDQAHQLVLKQTYAKPESHAKHATILYGMPASGKSTIAQTLLEKDESSIYLSIDDIYTQSPHYAELLTPQRFNERKAPFENQEFIEYGFDVLNYALQELAQRNNSVILDGVSGRLIPQLYTYFRSHNFAPQILNVVVPKRVMDMNMLTRYVMVRQHNENHFSFALPRPPELVKLYTQNLDSYQKEKLNLKLINPQTATILYDTEQKSSCQASDAFLHELYRPLTPDETEKMKDRQRVLLKQVEKFSALTERRQLTNAINCCLLPFVNKDISYTK